MTSTKHHPRNAVALVAATAAVASMLPMAAWAQEKQPPSCAAISFRPLSPTTGDGDHEAGLYKSRFGRVVVTGTVKGGQVSSYWVTVNNKRLADAGTLPGSVASCASSKQLPAPGKPADACVGNQLKVLIDRSEGKRYVLLYARQGRGWQMCSAGLT